VSAVKGKRRGWHFCPECNEKVYRLTQRRPAYQYPSSQLMAPPAIHVELAPRVKTKRIEEGLAVWCRHACPASFTIL
jgi:hypothetical protein